MCSSDLTAALPARNILWTAEAGRRTAACSPSQTTANIRSCLLYTSAGRCVFRRRIPVQGARPFLRLHERPVFGPLDKGCLLYTSGSSAPAQRSFCRAKNGQSLGGKYARMKRPYRLSLIHISTPWRASFTAATRCLHTLSGPGRHTRWQRRRWRPNAWG